MIRCSGVPLAGHIALIHADMNSTPRLTLTRIIAERGRGICDHPARLEALLRDLCGAYKREINVLVGALEERVAADLMSSARRIPRDTLLASLARRLHDARAYTPEAARWAVDSWAVALGVLTEDEFVRRESSAKQTDEPPAPPSAKATPPIQPVPPTRPAPPLQPRTTQGARRPPDPQPPPARTQPPPAPAAPPIRVAAKPFVLQPRAATSNAPVVNPPAQVQTPAPPKRNRFLTLRGCLVTVLLFVLIIVGAVFVVPPIIMLLREEQTRPSINDTRAR